MFYLGSKLIIRYPSMRGPPCKIPGIFYDDCFTITQRTLLKEEETNSHQKHEYPQRATRRALSLRQDARSKLDKSG